ncbi:uncharacterized protein [Onthophagus taurus]|uniref:uncharacterized protein n=1 Tax=Onthophagus taurus TaxID=166361 RepID=UPI000C20B813|nr:uncharacterized protein LOC111425765 [Onthophagus taurus]
MDINMNISNETENPETLHLMHVPWYNTDEWKSVYYQLFNADATKEDKKKALNTLIVWKYRMPRLYGLIEGTLILVQCLTMVDEDFSDEVTKHIVSSAILRFLNVCLCNSKSQQTFFHVAKTKNLPDWIVEIRHNFAHSQTLSSPEMLMRALKFLFNWIKENYWDQQVKTLQDYITPPITVFNDLLDLYEKVVEVSDKDYSATKLRRLLNKHNIRFHKCKYTLLQRIALALIEKPVNKSTIPDAIIKNNNFFKAAEISNDGFIVIQYQYCWNPLIFALIEWKIFYKFLKMLVLICCKNEDVNTAKKSAAWIKSICYVIKADKTTNILKTFNEQKSYENFVYWTTSHPNVYMKNYIKELLILGNFTDEFIFFTCLAAEALVPKPNSERPKNIYTLDSLREDFMEQLHEEIITENRSEMKGWQVVTNGDIFDGIPLGTGPDF